MNLQKKLAANPRDAFVAVNERLIFRQGMHERCSFERYRWIRVFTEDGLLRPSSRGGDAGRVAEFRRPDSLCVRGDNVFIGKVLQFSFRLEL